MVPSIFLLSVATVVSIGLQSAASHLAVAICEKLCEPFHNKPGAAQVDAICKA